MYQSTTLVGNLGSDPESRFTPGGDMTCTFSVAVNKTWKDASGQTQSKTTWFRVTAWRKLGETASQYLKKGMKVLIVGEMQPARAYTDKSGQPAAQLELTAENIRFLDSKGEGQASTGQTQTAPPPAAASVEDIPF
jgi:single-strand DNA-binding protein